MAQPVRSAIHCAGFYPEKNSRRQQLQKMKMQMLSGRNARRLRRKRAKAQRDSALSNAAVEDDTNTTVN